MSGAESDGSQDNSDNNGLDEGERKDSDMNGQPLESPPPLYSTDDYKIDAMQFTPMLVKSLMHRKVIKISSGGVHNICIVEPHPSELMEETYKLFMSGKYTNVIFKGFYQTFDDEKSEQKMLNQNSPGKDSSINFGTSRS